jgi:energy-coupling factor transport system permease protein
VIFHILHLAESLIAYAPGDRFLHRLNPITKMVLFVAVVTSCLVFSGPGYPWYLNFGILLLLVMVSLSGGVPLARELRLRGAYILAIVLVVFLGNLVFARGGESGEGNVYLSLRPFIYVSSLSLNFGLSKTLLILNSILIVIIVLKSTRLSDITHSMQRIGVPYPVAVLTSMSLRCVPMVTDGLLIVYNAQRARGMEMDKGGVRDRIRQWGTLLGPLMVVLLKWVDLMSLVFQSRGLDFSARRNRTRLRMLRFTWVDVVLTVALLASIVGLVYVARSGELRVVGQVAG